MNRVLLNASASKARLVLGRITKLCLASTLLEMTRLRLAFKSQITFSLTVSSKSPVSGCTVTHAHVPLLPGHTLAAGRGAFLYSHSVVYGGWINVPFYRWTGRLEQREQRYHQLGQGSAPQTSQASHLLHILPRRRVTFTPHVPAEVLRLQGPHA